MRHTKAFTLLPNIRFENISLLSTSAKSRYGALGRNPAYSSWGKVTAAWYPLANHNTFDRTSFKLCLFVNLLGNFFTCITIEQESVSCERLYKAREARLRWCGHIKRRNEEEMVRDVMKKKPEDVRDCRESEGKEEIRHTMPRDEAV